MTVITVVGLGRMGGAIASHLVRQGYLVRGFDPDPEAHARALSRGVDARRSLEDAVGGATHVLTSLPSVDALVRVWPRLCAATAPGTFLLELSTIDPDTMTALSDSTGAELRVLDCPVSGGPAEAEAGTLRVFLGASEQDAKDASEVLAALGAEVFPVGRVGAGKVVKLVNNVMSAVNIAGAAEAFAMGVRAGVEPRRLYEVLAVSGGTSRQFVKRFAHAVDGDYQARAALTIAIKDLDLARKFARDVHAASPLVDAAREAYREADRLGYGAEDEVAILKMFGTHRDD